MANIKAISGTLSDASTLQHAYFIGKLLIDILLIVDGVEVTQSTGCSLNSSTGTITFDNPKSGNYKAIIY